MSTLILLGDLPAHAFAAPAAASGGKVTQAPDVPTALTLAAQGAAVLFAEAGQDLATLFKHIRDNRLTLPVVVCGPAQPAVGAKSIRLGATEYLTLPLDTKLLEALLARLLPPSPEAASASGPIMGDPKTRALYDQVKQYAASNATVLLRGESGTGKEVFARAIHQNSPRAKASFVAVNCAAIPEALLESELFGHEKGAFSGALTKRIGKFQQADGGTLLLDEISEMDLALQAKLLRAIQERVIDPVGSDKPVPVDIRLIATTNRQLESYVAEGKFREDLYFRLNVVALELPPLRERPGDILPLAQHFATQYRNQGSAKQASTGIGFSQSATEKLLGCYWKGNVRELENTVHRAVLLAGDAPEISADNIVLSPMSLQHMSLESNNLQSGTQPAGSHAAPLAQAAAQAYASGGAGPATFVPRTLAAAEREVLVQTLSYTQGNRQYAADLLGISVLLLKEKLTSLGLAET